MERAFSISITLTDQPPPLDQLSNKKACSFGGPPRGSANVYAYCACFFFPCVCLRGHMYKGGGNPLYRELAPPPFFIYLFPPMG